MSKVSAPPDADKKDGKGCGCALFGFLFLIGLSLFGYWAFSDYQIFTTYKQATCTVTGKRVLSRKGSGSNSGTTYKAEVDFTFKANGRTVRTSGYDGWSIFSSGKSSKTDAIKPFQIGRSYPCWYDPQNPRKAILVKRISWLYLVPVLLMALSLIGMFFMYRKKTGPSKEARAFEKLQNRGSLGSPDGDGPTLKTETGQVLAVRLGRQVSTFAKVLGLLFFSTFWNGIVSVFLYQIWKDFAKGGSAFSWFTALFMVPFVLIGLLVIGLTIHQFLVWVGVGETIIEISNARLRPGEPFEIWISQAGNMTMNALTATLVCEERATYQQGTNTHTATEKVIEEELAVAQHAPVTRSRPLEVRQSCRIPVGAMHSFKARSNEITWYLQVVGDIARWPDFERKFPIVVEALPPQVDASGPSGQAPSST